MEKRARAERNCSVDIGSMDESFLLPKSNIESETGETEIPRLRLAFGKLIELERRNRGLSVEEFASANGLDAAELETIECNAFYVPEPSTVYQLASVLHIPQTPLLQLAGLTEAKDEAFVHEAVRFAANSKSRAKLTPDERLALETFVAEISKRR